MNKKNPPYETMVLPCSSVVLYVASKEFGVDYNEIRYPKTTKQGYCSLVDMTKALSDIFLFDYIYYTKDERFYLKDIESLSKRYGMKKAIICVRGHYIYVDDDTYYSFFPNLGDEVIAIWFLKGVRQ